MLDSSWRRSLCSAVKISSGKLFNKTRVVIAIDKFFFTYNALKYIYTISTFFLMDDKKAQLSFRIQNYINSFDNIENGVEIADLFSYIGSIILLGDLASIDLFVFLKNVFIPYVFSSAKFNSVILFKVYQTLHSTDEILWSSPFKLNESMQVFAILDSKLIPATFLDSDISSCFNFIYRVYFKIISCYDKKKHNFNKFLLCATISLLLFKESIRKNAHDAFALILSVSLRLFLEQPVVICKSAKETNFQMDDYKFVICDEKMDLDNPQFAKIITNLKCCTLNLVKILDDTAQPLDYSNILISAQLHDIVSKCQIQKEQTYNARIHKIVVDFSKSKTCQVTKFISNVIQILQNKYGLTDQQCTELTSFFVALFQNLFYYFEYSFFRNSLSEIQNFFGRLFLQFESILSKMDNLHVISIKTPTIFDFNECPVITALIKTLKTSEKLNYTLLYKIFSQFDKSLQGKRMKYNFNTFKQDYEYLI